jgi:hypothetical protein
MDFDVLSELLARFAPALIAVVFGGYGLVTLVRIFATAEAARRWPTTLGIVRRAELELLHNPSADHTHYVWMPVIAYDYEVNGTLYTGSRIAPVHDTGYSVKDWAAAKIAPYAVGDSVEVLYHPKRPHRSCLEISTDGLLVALILTLVGAGFGLYFCFNFFQLGS